MEGSGVVFIGQGEGELGRGPLCPLMAWRSWVTLLRPQGRDMEGEGIGRAELDA